MNSRRKVTLNDVAKTVSGKLTGDGSKLVSDVTHDSRQVRAGWLFAAVCGEHVDAHKFIHQVGEKGAAGVLSERERPEDFKGAWIQVSDVRRAMAHLIHAPMKSSGRSRSESTPAAPFSPTW